MISALTQGMNHIFTTIGTFGWLRKPICRCIRDHMSGNMELNLKVNYLENRKLDEKMVNNNHVLKAEIYLNKVKIFPFWRH